MTTSETAPPVNPDLRDRILRAFTERARHAGLRAVVMAEVARDLGISTKTLYKVFESKEQVVQALMERWASMVEAGLRAGEASAAVGADGSDIAARLKNQAVVWADVRNRFSPAFWSELERDYPGPFAVFSAAREQARRVVRRRVAAELRPELDPELVQELYDALTRRAADPDVCRRLNVTPHDALVQAITIFTSGALDR